MDEAFENPVTFDPVRDIKATGDLTCKNGCEITLDTPMLGGGYCEACVEYPEG